MENPIVDVVIVGAGPGGMSSALWCSELGLTSVILEASQEAGGQLLWTHNRIDNHLGMSAANGAEMRDRLLEQISDRAASIRFGSRVTGFDPDHLSVELNGTVKVTACAIIVATGVRRRDPGIVDVDRYVGRGILESGKKEKNLAKGKRAIVVGGGDAAFENALILADTANEVILVHRSDQFRAREEFINKVASNRKITIVPNSSVEGLAGDESLENVTVRDLKTGSVSSIEAGALVFRIGVEPNSAPFSPKVRTDNHGYIEVDYRGRTSVPGVYAVGDVANPVSPTISSAIGMGATAVKDLFLRLSQSPKDQ